MPLIQTVHGGLNLVHPNPSKDSPHPEIDCSKFAPVGEGDVRSPCPLLNALANHGFLPHDGKGLTKSMVQTAAAGVGADSGSIGKIFDMAKPTFPPGHTVLDLDNLAKHGVLEHDVSLSRQDVALGDNLHFDADIWRTVLETIGSRTTVDYATAAKVKRTRYLAAKRAHAAAGKPFDWNLRALAISYVECSAIFRILLGPGMKEVPVKWLRVLFEEGRLPYDEGWRPCYDDAGRPSMQKIVLSVIWHNSGFGRELLAATAGSVRGLFRRNEALSGLAK